MHIKSDIITAHDHVRMQVLYYPIVFPSNDFISKTRNSVHKHERTVWRRVSKQSIRARLKNSLATYVTHLSTNDKPEPSVSFKFDEICDSETCREATVSVPSRESDRFRSLPLSPRF